MDLRRTATPDCASELLVHLYPPSLVFKALISLIVSETVDQLYQKSIEPKPTPKDAPKPKAPSKPTKKEHPAFNINPKIAKGFLDRLQAGKEFETGHLGRPIYEEEENHAAVHFAPAQEQYSQWKDIEEYEEKVEVPSDRAESWADKLRRKQNIANGIVEEQTPKGSRGQSLLDELPLTPTSYRTCQTKIGIQDRI